MNERQKEISRKILDHLRKYPDAGDTLKGISDWWIEFECIEQAVDEVKSVLDLLIEKGLIECEVLNSRTNYRVNQNRIDDI